MGIIAWVAVGLAAGLLANMLFPGKRSRGLVFTALTGISAVLGGDWTASLFRTHGLANFPGRFAALAENGGPAPGLPAAHQGRPSRAGGLTRRGRESEVSRRRWRGYR